MTADDEDDGRHSETEERTKMKGREPRVSEDLQPWREQMNQADTITELLPHVDRQTDRITAKSTEAQKKSSCGETPAMTTGQSVRQTDGKESMY